MLYDSYIKTGGRENHYIDEETGKKQLIEIKLKMMQILKLTDKNFKASIIHMFKNLMEKICTTNKQIKRVRAWNMERKTKVLF